MSRRGPTAEVSEKTRYFRLSKLSRNSRVQPVPSNAQRRNESHACRQVHRFEQDARLAPAKRNGQITTRYSIRPMSRVAGTESCSFMLTAYSLRPSPAIT